MPIRVHITDPVPGSRRSHPVRFSVPRDALDGDASLLFARTDTGEQIVCQRLATLTGQGVELVAALSFTGSIDLEILQPVADQASVAGIYELKPREKDAFARLNTGWFDLELCRGTGDGTGASKWGLRHFAQLDEGLDLLPSGNNAIGGFYGPFFTPENGLINPPEHTVADVKVVESGPILKHYRLSGTIPDGLREELRGRRFSIDWIFTHGSPFFERTYHVDHFTTVVNGRSIVDKITVGDEFESGQGSVVFDRFAAKGGTRYRAGDPYAGLLVKAVAETLASPGSRPAKFEIFRALLGQDLESAHWDLYWRLFCVWEQALSTEELSQRLDAVRAEAHVLADLTDRRWILADALVDVSAHPHETIFPGPADKTAELSTTRGQAMVWWTSAPSGAFQIVQRPQSGWVNWGTNGENECPELPVGTTIRTAYGAFADSWETIAEQLANEPVATVVEN
jgi:hypothetical protein